ncbi:MAG: DUF3179 domain-containing (seleno)protein, partial [Gaiellaceae bacterium]
MRRFSLALSAALLLAGCGGTNDAVDTAEPASPDQTTTAAAAEDSAAASSFASEGWETDFSRRSVPLAEFESGGPPKDGIPAIDEPKLVGIAEAERWLDGREPVIALTVAGETRAYPIQILTWHEIVNDEIGGVPVAVTFCPLCNTA